MVAINIHERKIKSKEPVLKIYKVCKTLWYNNSVLHCYQFPIRIHKDGKGYDLLGQWELVR